MTKRDFRAKTINGKWVYGAYLFDPIHDRHFILTFDISGNIREQRVDGETVGQNTGEKDMRGKEIYKDDIVKANHWLDKRKRINGEVKYEKGGFIIDFTDIEIILSIMESKEMEIIGNKFDNPELLKKETK